MLSGISRRIIVSNLIGLPLFFVALLVMNSSRTSLTDTQIRLLTEQAEILASILTLVPSERYDISQDRLIRRQGNVGFYLREPILPHDMDALLFDINGTIIEDSRNHLPGKITVTHLPDIGEKSMHKSRWQILSHKIMRFMHRSRVTDFLIFQDNVGTKGQDFIEFHKAILGHNSSVIRIDQYDRTILSVAVPVRRLGKVLGVLKVSSSTEKIANALHKEQQTLIIFFLIALMTTLSTSFLLARNIAVPLKKLANFVRLAEKSNFRPQQLETFQLYELSSRVDEIGTLSLAFDNMIKKLKHHFSDLESFAADVAHELKNPLTSLRSSLDLILKISDQEKKNKLFEVIKHDVKRMDRLIGDISNLSRIDAEMNREDYQMIDLIEMMSDLVEHYQQGALSENITIHFHAHQSPVIFHGIADRIGRTFSNVIENAISFTPPNGRIDIKIKVYHSRIIISIMDTGRGIDPLMIDKIFERFYSDRPEQNSFGNHSGLGLAIVKRIVHSHGGTIHAQNRQDIDSGAVFTITLPI